MATPTRLARFADVTRARAAVLWDQARQAASERVAELTGRAAGWIDDAGDGFGRLAEGAASRVCGFSYTAGEATGRRAERIGECLALAVRSWSAELGDGVVHLGESLTAERRPAPRAPAAPESARV